MNNQMPEIIIEEIELTDKLPTKDAMLYPREEGKTLVQDNQMVSYREHLSRKNRMVFLTGPISDDSESCNLLMALSSISDEPLKMIVTSPGGYLDATYMFCDTMKMIMEKTPIYVLGRYVCSAAVLPFVCAKKRYLLPHAKMMLHLPWGQIQGDTKEIEIQRKEMEKTQSQMVEFLRENGVRKSVKQIMLDIDREKWMNPQEAIDYGLADEIMNPDVMKEWLS